MQYVDDIAPENKSVTKPKPFVSYIDNTPNRAGDKCPSGTRRNGGAESQTLLDGEPHRTTLRAWGENGGFAISITAAVERRRCRYITGIERVVG
jgi:hypothetical protein